MMDILKKWAFNLPTLKIFNSFLSNTAVLDKVQWTLFMSFVQLTKERSASNLSCPKFASKLTACLLNGVM